MDKKLVDLRIVESTLVKVIFTIGHPESGKQYQVKIADEIEVTDVGKSSFALLFTRKTTSEEPFLVDVCFRTSFEIIDPNQVGENQETVEEYAERVKENLALKLSLPSRASMVIADITRESLNAFITPPALSMKK